MPATEILTGSAMTRKVWATSLGHDSLREQYFARFMGEGDDTIIKIKKDLQKEAGDKISMDVRARLTGDSAEGNVKIEGDTRYETSLEFYTDSIYIDVRRKTVKKYGYMTNQRVPYNLRKECKDALTEYYGEDTDQIMMIFLAGARGVNSDFNVPLTFTGLVS